MGEKIYSQPERYESINALRVVAAIGILMLHVFYNSPIKPSKNILTDSITIIFPGFSILFMILSGFSIFCGYYTKFKKNKISLNDFYIKRYKKTLPFFGLLILIDLAINPTKSSLYEAFTNMTLAFSLLPNGGKIEMIGVGWFLGVLFLFYMLFPFFVFLLDNKRRAWFMLIISIIFAYIGKDYFGVDRSIQIFRTNMVIYIPYFILGGIIYLYKDSIRKFISKKAKLFLGICFLSIIIYLYIYVFKKVEYGNFETKLFIFCLWMMYAISVDNKMMHNKVIDYICNFRLEIYLSHMVIFRVVEKLHIEKFISNNDLYFTIVLLLTIFGTITFAHIIKKIVFPRTINKLIKI